MTDDSQTKPKHAKRYTRWLVAALFLVIAVGCLAVWIPYNHKLETIHEIEARGGLVITDRTSPDWVRRLIGSKRTRGFDTVVEVALKVDSLDLLVWRAYDSNRIKSSPGNIGNDDIKMLSGLSELRKLKLTSSDITDSGLEELTHLKKLEKLGLWSTMVTEEGILNLVEQLPNLKKLYLNSYWKRIDSNSGPLSARVREINSLLDIEFVDDPHDFGPHFPPPGAMDQPPHTGSYY